MDENTIWVLEKWSMRRARWQQAPGCYGSEATANVDKARLEKVSSLGAKWRTRQIKTD